MEVFKFCSLDTWSIRNIYYSQLFFSEIQNLNDAGECLFSVEDDIGKRKLTDEELKEITNKIIFLYSNIDDNCSPYFKGLKKRGLGLKEVCVYIIEAVLKSYRSCSFTDKEGAVNPIMWGHYGDSSKGVCIRYEIDDKELEEIKYIDDSQIENIKTSDVLKYGSQDIANRVFFKKNKDWQYEKEYRIIQTGSLRSIDRKAMTGIFFGSNVNVEDAEFLCDIVKEKYGNIDIAITYHTRLTNKMVNFYLQDKNMLLGELKKRKGRTDMGTRYIVEDMTFPPKLTP